MKAKSKCCCPATCFCAIFAFGILLAAVLGYFFWAEFDCKANAVAALFAVGFSASYFLLSALAAIVHAFALRSAPLPDGLDLTDRSVAAEQAAAIKGRSPLASNLRVLLRAVANGAPGPQIARMAASQTNRAILARLAEAAAVVAILVAAADFGAPQSLLSIGSALLVLVPLSAFARIQISARSAGYIEGALLALLPNAESPASAAADFAAKAAKSVQASTDALADAQTRAADALAKAQTQAADSLAQAQAGLAEQLKRVTDVAASVDKVLQLQLALDKSLAGVSAADGFKATLDTLQKHLDDSNALLRSAAKPRTIRLVENPLAD